MTGTGKPQSPSSRRGRHPLASRVTPPPWRLDGLTAVVTGAASGIGAATALLFGEVGATVMAGRRPRRRWSRANRERDAGAGKAAPSTCRTNNP